MKRNYMIRLVLLLFAVISGQSMKAQTFSGGTGTETDPYQIASLDDWNTLAYAIVGNSDQAANDFADKYFKMTADIEQKGKPKTGVNGNFRLEVCLSDDHQFCALQLFRFADFSYRPFYEPRFYEGTDVEYITKLF